VSDDGQLTKGTGRLARYHPDLLLLVVDLASVLVFAVEGAMAGIRAELDALGLMVVAFATALGAA
jgi:uncharacterized membrane protein YeiH